MLEKLKLGRWVLSAVAGAAMLAATGAMAQELKVGYMPNAIQDAAVVSLKKWGEKNNVKVTLIPMAYNVYMEKVTSTLTSGGDQFDVIWHNDDWGQLWEKWLEPIEDPQVLKLSNHWGIDLPFKNAEGKNTVVPMAHTFGVFFYRSDLLKENELPRTWQQLVDVSKRLQKEGKVKYGFVGGMAMNHTWFTWLWSMWTNNCDVMLPIFERDNKKLEAAGWKAAVNEPCMRQVVEFWWDAINTHKISPPGMPSYGRSEGNALFMAGEAAFTVVDSVHWGEFNDPKKSKVAGKVNIGFFPLGPNRKEAFAWNDIWGWAIPKGVPAERKALAKKMLAAWMVDEESQTAMWSKTGGPPPNEKLWAKIAEKDPFMRQLKKVSLDITPPAHAAYYFAKWPAVHKAFSDTVVAAVKGKREDIPKELAKGAPYIHEAAAK